MNNIKVLIIEDRSSVVDGIKERIINDLNIPEEKIAYYCFADEALGFLEQNTPQIIIIDLAMDPVGLTKEDQNQSKSSRLTGWVFLKNYVINGHMNDRLLNTHCYIFSGYGLIFSSELGIDTSNGSINISTINNKLSEVRQNIFFVPKSGIDGGASDLIRAIKKYSNKIVSSYI